MNHFREGIRAAIEDSFLLESDENEELTSDIYLKLLPYLAKIVIMRNLQRNYFRRRDQDTFIKANSMEIEVDSLLVGVHDSYCQIEIPIEVK